MFNRTHIPETYEGLYKNFQGEVPELEEMEDTPQDPTWHAEGDVGTHTRMVLDELEEMSSEGLHDTTSVILGSFFHDIGKVERTKTRTIDGKTRIVSPGHARSGRSIVGRHLANRIPWDLWWRTIQLVGFHHEPRKIVNIDDPAERESEIQWLDRMVDLRDLYTLCLADTRGRECPDRRSRLDILSVFDLERKDVQTRRGERSVFRDYWDPPIEQELTGYPRETIEFVQAEARFSAGRNEIQHCKEAISQSYQYRDDHPTLILLCGPSGSGKSTWIEKHQPGAAVVSLDRIRAEIGDGPGDHSNEGKVRQASKTRLKEHLADGETVVWDATNYRRDFRRPLIQLGYQYGAFVRMVVFCVPFDVCVERSREHIVRKQFDAWQLPLSDECHVVEYLDMDHEKRIKSLGGECIQIERGNDV